LNIADNKKLFSDQFPIIIAEGAAPKSFLILLISAVRHDEKNVVTILAVTAGLQSSDFS